MDEKEIKNIVEVGIMVGDFFEGTKADQFEDWLRRVVGRDDRYSHLLDEDFEDERTAFYAYFDAKKSPYQALQEEYQKYG